MAYPAVRRQPRDSQPRRERPRPKRSSPVGTPSNDNPRPLPPPANDNSGTARPKFPTSVALKLARKALKLGRVHPAIRALSVAYDVYELLNRTYEMPAKATGGWSLVWTCYGGTFPVDDRREQTTASGGLTALRCLGGQFDSTKWTDPIGNTIRSIVRLQRQIGASSTKYKCIEGWSRPGTGPTVAPHPSPQAKPPQALQGALAPETLKPYDPAPYAEMPYLLLPYRPQSQSPTEGTSRGYGDAIPLASSGHKLEPPGPGVRERKARITGAAALLNGLAGQAGEALDLANVLYDALPWYVKPEGYGRKSSQAQRLKLIYRHIDKIDIEKAIVGYILNQAEDQFYGRLSNLTRNPFTGRSGQISQLADDPILNAMYELRAQLETE